MNPAIQEYLTMYTWREYIVVSVFCGILGSAIRLTYWASDLTFLRYISNVFIALCLLYLIVSYFSYRLSTQATKNCENTEEGPQ